VKRRSVALTLLPDGSDPVVDELEAECESLREEGWIVTDDGIHGSVRSRTCPREAGGACRNESARTCLPSRDEGDGGDAVRDRDVVA
jgi:hypothetical protein